MSNVEKTTPPKMGFFFEDVTQRAKMEKIVHLPQIAPRFQSLNHCDVLWGPFTYYVMGFFDIFDSPLPPCYSLL